MKREHRRTYKPGVFKHYTVFAYRNGELRGMVVKEEEGWIVKVGAFGHAYGGSYGYLGTREKCVQVGVDGYNYTFKTI